MTVAGVTIRDFVDSDETAVVVLVRQLQAHDLQHYGRMKPPSAIDGSYVSLLRSDVAEHRGRFLVAELAGQVVGYCTLFTHCDSSDETDEVFYTYAYVGDLAVDERHRGLGIGALLMSTCEMTARDAGQTWLRISVMAENDLARRFYARVGFGEHLLTLEKRL